MVDQKIISADIISAQIKIWNRLQKIVSSKHIGNAYLFSGAPGCGKEGIALKFAQLLNCNGQSNNICGQCPSCMRFLNLQHENLKLIFPLPTNKSAVNKKNIEIDNKDLDLVTHSIGEKSKDPFFKIQIPNANRILIQSIRRLRKSLYLKSTLLGRRTVIIFDAHFLSKGKGETGNAFLKLLEEPPRNTTIILVTDHAELLFATITSRCQRIIFPRLKNKYIKKWCNLGENDMALLTGLSRGNFHQTRFLITHSTEDLVLLIENLIDCICNDEPEKWRRFILNYSKMAKQNRAKFSFHFSLLTIWFYSANKLMKNLNDILHKTNLKVGMNNIINQYTRADFSSIVIHLEESITAIYRNQYMPLVLINLLLNIQKALQK